MKTNNNSSAIRQDLSLLAIEAAEELTRFKKGLPTDFKSLEVLNDILIKSSPERISDDSSYRLDHYALISSAGSVIKKSILQIADEAMRIASLSNSRSNRPHISEIDKLITFYVTLADNAALYSEELEELNSKY